MPQAAKCPCRKPGCPTLTDDGYCDDHRQHRWEADRYRGNSASRGYSHDWQVVRLQALKRDRYLCVDCLLTDRVTLAKDVHHVMKLSQHPELRLMLSNLKSLCKECHAKYTARGE